MKTWLEHKQALVEDAFSVAEYREVSKDQLAEIAVNYFAAALRQTNLPTWGEWQDKMFVEAVEASRYAIEVNYRTDLKDAEEGFAKIALGYVSAALKAHNYHVKMVFTEKPVRILVSSRNWDDGEWVGMISWNPDHHCFILSKGFFNKMRKTVSVNHSEKMKGTSGAELAGDLRNMMHQLKNTPDAHREKLKPVPLKRGPKS
jgi:hypothetical protein